MSETFYSVYPNTISLFIVTIGLFAITNQLQKTNTTGIPYGKKVLIGIAHIIGNIVFGLFGAGFYFFITSICLRILHYFFSYSTQEAQSQLLAMGSPVLDTPFKMTLLFCLSAFYLDMFQLSTGARRRIWIVFGQVRQNSPIGYIYDATAAVTLYYLAISLSYLIALCINGTFGLKLEAPNEIATLFLMPQMIFSDSTINLLAVGIWVVTGIAIGRFIEESQIQSMVRYARKHCESGFVNSAWQRRRNGMYLAAVRYHWAAMVNCPPWFREKLTELRCPERVMGYDNGRHLCGETFDGFHTAFFDGELDKHMTKLTQYIENDVDLAVAIDEYKALQEKLEPKSKCWPNYRFWLAAIQWSRGELYEDLGQVIEAESEYCTAIEILTELRDDLAPRGRWCPQYRNALAVTHTSRARLYHALGRDEAALADFDTAIDVLADLVATDIYSSIRYNSIANALWLGSGIRYESNLAQALLLRAGFQHDLGKLTQAEIDYDKSIKILTDLCSCLRHSRPRADGEEDSLRWVCERLAVATNEPVFYQASKPGWWSGGDDMRWAFGLAVAYNNRAVLYRAQGCKPAHAMKDYDTAIDIYRAAKNQIHWSDWLAQGYEEGLAAIYSNRGLHYSNTLLTDNPVKMGSEASGDFYAAASMLERLAEGKDSPPKYRHGLALTYNNWGVFQYRIGWIGKALNDFSHADSILKTIPSGVFTDYDVTRAVVYSNQAAMLAHMPSAHSWAEGRSRLLVEILELDPAGTHSVSGLKLRAAFFDFHRHWMRHCLDNQDYACAIAIFTAVQGRKLAQLLMDEIDNAVAGTSLPEPVLKLKRIRRELREKAHEMRVAYGGYGSTAPSGNRASSGAGGGLLIESQYNQLKESYRQTRGEVQAIASYHQLAAAYQPISLETLQAKIGCSEMLVLWLDMESDEHGEPVHGLLVLRCKHPPSWIPLNEPIPIKRILADYCSWLTGSRHRTGRLVQRGVAISDDAERPAHDQAKTSFWFDLRQTLQEKLWQPLTDAIGPAFEDLERVIFVTQGQTHLIPLELGAPENLRITHYPGLLFYLHTTRVSPCPADTLPDKAIGLCSYIGDPPVQGEMDTRIPMALVETGAIESFWKKLGHPQTLRNYNYGIQDSPPILGVHLSCHGGEDMLYPWSTTLKAGPDRVLDTRGVLTSQACPVWVIAAACLAGTTKEDPDGDPSGIVPVFLLRGTRVVIGALLPVSDNWMTVLSLLIHQVMGREHLSPPQALVAAKERLRTGTWYTDTKELLLEAAANLTGEMSPRALASIEEVVTRRIPPEPELDILLYSVRAFGDL